MDLIGVDIRENVEATVMTAMTQAHMLFRRLLKVSCWHINEHESAAMWKLYGGQTGNSVAIRSTYARLRACLPPTAYLGVVNYIDFTTGELPVTRWEGNQGWNLFDPVMHKRRSFAHERELRAVIHDPMPMINGKLDLNYHPTDAGEWVSLDLMALITEFRVAPQADRWFEELVRTVTARFGWPRM